MSSIEIEDEEEGVIVEDTDEIVEENDEEEIYIRGPRGLQGKQGPVGPQGPAGKDGKDGKNGRDGVDGKNGKDGRDGRDGTDGLDGMDGLDGIDGLDGKDGKDGVGLAFKWDGTKLGVKREDEKEYTFQDLIGPAGDAGKTLIGGSSRTFRLSGTGVAQTLISDSKAGAATIKDIEAGTNVTFTVTDDKITINSSGSGSGGHIIQDEGTPLTARANLNFVGTNVTVTDDVGNDATVVTISGGSGISDGDKGDITVSGSGTTWTIDNGAVTLAKQADVASSTVFYRKTAGTGSPEVQTLATLKTDLGLTGTNSGDQTITLTGDVTGSGTGSFAATIANGVVTNDKVATGIDAIKIADGSVSNTEFQYLNGVTSAIQTQLDGKVDENAPITGATKTKVTYDAKGLVTAGADATTADIADSTNRRYVTDAQLTVIGNTSGTNSGDQNLFSTIAVSGQSNVVADSTSDTLTLVAGTNITITTNATTDEITITASGGSGDVTKVGTPVNNQVGVWTGDGTLEGDVALTFDTTTDTLSIGASGTLAFGAVTVLSDSAGTTTLQNIDALDATTEATIEAAIDTLANLTSIQGQSVTFSGAATLSGTNTGDQTSIVGITGTTAEFNTALTDGDFATLAGSESLTNKTLNNSNTVTFRDDRFTLQDNADTTKQAVFQLSGITTGTTRTLTLPNVSGTIVTTGDTGSVTNAMLAGSIDLTTKVTGDLPFSNIAQIATDRLLGRDTAGTGDIETLTVGGGIEFTGTGIQTSAFTGDVTKSAGGTALTIANDAVTFAKMQNVAANSVPARAASSSGDLSEVALSASQLLGRGSTGDIAAITIGSGLSMSGTTLSTTGGSATAVTKSINQASHGFTVGEVVRLSGTSTYDEAQADSAANAEAVGIVSAVADVDNFTLTTSGYVNGLSGLTANTMYFLSASTAGILTATEPTTAGQISKPCFYADSTTSGYFINYRGSVVADTALEQARDDNGVYVLANSAVAVNSTNTATEETLATIAVPANAMGANGWFEVTCGWSVTNNANAKTARIRFGGTEYLASSLASTAQNNQFRIIMNRGATNSQIGISSSTRPEVYGTASSNAMVTSAHDTTSSQNITITSQKATGTDSMTLEWYIVKLYPR